MKYYGKEKISKATLSRLPGYLLYLNNRKTEGQSYISSTVMARELEQNPVQVRKDLSLIASGPGKPRRGFVVDALIRDIEEYLGYNAIARAVIVGVGQLGRTLLSFGGFEARGAEITAGFDETVTEGESVHGKRILPMCELGRFVRENGIRIGIIAVPDYAAQGVATLLVEAGIEAIWNFAPTHISVPRGVVVKNEDLASSLALLARQLK